MSSISRFLHGAYIAFDAGCLVTSIHSKQPVPITRDVCVTVDVKRVCVKLHAAAPKPNFAQFGTIEKQDQQVKSAVRTIFVDYDQHEHALAATKSLPGATLVYRLFFDMRKCIAPRVRHTIEVIVTTWEDVRCAWFEHTVQDRIRLIISGTTRHTMARIKALIERILAGSIVKQLKPGSLQGATAPAYELWSSACSSNEFKDWLDSLSKHFHILILPDSMQQCLRIYSGNEHTTNHVEALLAPVISQLKENDLNRLALDKCSFKNLQKHLLSNSSQLRDICGAIVTNDTTNRIVTFQCSKQRLSHACTILGARCVSNCKLSTEAKLLSCGHCVCLEEFENLINSTLTGIESYQFPLRCWLDTCGKPIEMSELREYVSGHELEKMLMSSLKHHVRVNARHYSHCRTPDCPSVYVREFSGPQLVHVCNVCLASTCLQCGHKPHPDETCEDYGRKRKTLFPNEHLSENDINDTAHGTRPCPGCKTLIEKDEGCNTMACAVCGISFCWICLETFRSPVAAGMHITCAH